MDVVVCAGGDSTRRKADSAGEGGTMEIVPLDLYDSARAKIDANLRWLLAKAYGIDHIPEDLRDPFYTDQYDQEHIKPPIIRLLLSGELYCRVCGLILKGEQAASLKTHLSVIQALSRKGIYVQESDNTPVSDDDLSGAPVKMSSHIPLIDALMMAYTVEMISIERVVSSVKRFSTFSASKELPFDLEDAIVFWINKVNMKMREITEKELKIKQHLLESPSHPKPDLMHALAHCLLEPEEFSRVVRYRRDHLSGRTLQHFPLLDDLMKDVCDGTALLAVVHFYCPELMRLEDVCLKEVPSIADSLYNIQLLREFSNEYLDRGFYLRPEDLLYAPPVLKNNVMVFIAELFWWFEIVKPDFVQPRDLQDIKDVRSLLQPKSSRPHVPISNATKRSFLAMAGSSDVMATSLSPDVCNSSKVSPAASPSHSLLPLRQRQQNATLQEDDSLGQMNRSSSMTRMDGQAQGSILAWPERRPRPLSQPVPYALHFPMEGEGDSVSLARSISKDSLASNVMSMTPKHMLGLPGVHLPTRRLNGQGLLGHIRIEDEEKEVEEEELVAIIHPATLARRHLESDMEQDDLEVPRVTSRVCGARSPLLSPHSPLPAPHSPLPALCPETQPDSFFLEPLMPAVLKPAKEKTVSLNKEEESGESRSRAGFRRVPEGPTTAQRRGPAPEHELNRTFTPIHSAELTSGALRPPTEGAVGSSQPALRPQVEPISREQSCGFFLHLSEPGDQTALNGQVRHSPYSTAWDVGRDSDSEIADLDLEEDEEEEEEQMELAKEVLRRLRGKCLVEGEEVGEGEGESDKLREDMKVCEREDKEGGSGRSSPCLSTVSWASSASGSTSVRMTSFAERKHQKISFPDGFSSASSSQKTTPDGSESAPYPLGGSWRLRREGSPCRLGKEGAGVGKEVVASELLQLHMQLEEQRRAIEHQKKKMETLSARQRLKLGKAAFLNIVKKGKSDTLPLPLKHHQEAPEQTANGGKALSSRDDSCLDVLRGQGKGTEGQGDRDNRTHSSAVQEEVGVEPEVGECSRSIELLNEAISSIQKQMMQLSLQQDRLMKQSVKSPPGAPSSGPPAPGMAQTSTPSSASSSASTPTPTPTLTPTPESRVRPAVHFVELATTTTTSATAAPTRRPPRLSSSRSPRTKPSDLKLTKENVRPVSSKSAIADPRPSLGRRSPKGWEQEGERRGESSAFTVFAESPRGIERGSLRSTTFRVGDEDNLRSSRDGPSSSLRDGPSNSPDQPPSQDPLPPCVDEPEGWDGSGLGGSSKEGEEASRGKGGHLIEVDLSDLNGTEEGGSDTPDTSADGEQKSGLGFFFKDEEKAEDEITKRRAAFLQKQLRKAEESRLRKLQQEADSELKRDEVRRKAEEDRVRKEEEKARRELIKQEYLRRKQEELMEEQGLVKPRPRSKPRKTRPKSLHRGESSTDTFSKRSTTPDLSCSRLGSTPSLATETESVTSGGAESQRAGSLGSVESFPLLSRNSSRNMERDWENGSTASSITSTAEYHGPKLFKEPSSKSNKPIIHNAIAHCCLAGKVNETQKNNILEELERCESNHLLILFRDGGCQFRGIYSFHPDTEEIIKFIGTGPRSISRKMIDKLYKYSSDRKQFTHIPAKNVSVTVDALTIHNHLWQIKRPSGSKKK